MSRRKTPKPDDCPCSDCGAATNPSQWTPDAQYEWYDVYNAIWAAAGMPYQGYLCIGCLETRIGRQLTAADFTDAPVNSLAVEYGRFAWSQRSERLAGRLLDGMDLAELGALVAGYEAATGSQP